MPIRRILCASDFSPASRPAVKLATEMARAFDADLMLFHAYQVSAPMSAEGPLPPAVVDTVARDAHDQARRKLDALAESTKGRRTRSSTLLAEGSPAEAIVTAAKRKRANLIVLGTRGRSGLGRMLMGSVAESVVRTAPCPVLTVGSNRAD